MREIEEDLSVYNGVEIPDGMRGDPLRNPALAELDCPPGPNRFAAFQTYSFVKGLYRVGEQQGFLLHPRSVVRAYQRVRGHQRAEARKFTLLHVLLRGIYAQLWLESNEEYGARYRTIFGTNQLIDETIQWMYSQWRAR